MSTTHLLGQEYWNPEPESHTLPVLGILVGGAVVIFVAILLYRYVNGASLRSHQRKELELRIRKDAVMAELREQTACRCPRCGTQMELVRKEALPAAVAPK